MKSAVLLDRDGVINEKAPEGEYVTRWEDFRFLPGTSEAIALLNNAGFAVIVVSNQRCISKGLVTPSAVEALHGQMCQELAKAGATIDRIYYCPHDYPDACVCRKPKPGMLLEAAKDFDLTPASSWMVGDSNSDVQAGKNAGFRTILVSQRHKSGISPDIVAGSLLEAAKAIVGEAKN